MFFVDSGVLFTGALTWLFIDTRRSVEDARSKFVGWVESSRPTNITVR